MTKKAVQRPVTVRKKETGIYVSFIDFAHYGCFQQKNILSECVKFRKKNTSHSKISFLLSALEYLHSPLCLLNSLCMNSKKKKKDVPGFSVNCLSKNIFPTTKSFVWWKRFCFLSQITKLWRELWKLPVSINYFHWKCPIKNATCTSFKYEKKKISKSERSCHTITMYDWCISTPL